MGAADWGEAVEKQTIGGHGAGGAGHGGTMQGSTFFSGKFKQDLCWGKITNEQHFLGGHFSAGGGYGPCGVAHCGLACTQAGAGAHFCFQCQAAHCSRARAWPSDRPGPTSIGVVASVSLREIELSSWVASLAKKASASAEGSEPRKALR